MTAPDELDRQALQMAHQELTARLTGAGWGFRGEQPPLMRVVVPERNPVLAEPACRQQLEDLMLLGRTENITVEIEGAP